ncbi:MAG: MBL fold metallo-hydrolase [Mobilitalea sp.]
MYELIKIGERTYYINCPAKIGIYQLNDTDVYLIDSGNDKEAGKKVLKILSANNWCLKAIINTHSNADHIGGNKLLKDRTDCEIYTTRLEGAFTEYPMLESSFLYGGYPNKALRNKFLLAESSSVHDISELPLPEGMEIFPLKGHFFDMIGVKTPDDVYFIADCISGENILEKYHVAFIYDVAEYLKTLTTIETLNGRYFVPAHADASENIKSLVAFNRNKVDQIIRKILDICKSALCFEEILKNIFDEYELTMDFNQYVLVGSTIRSYLSYLYDEGKIIVQFENNTLLWKTI